MRDYKKIKAWQLADQLVFKVYETTQDFPREERYGLTSQLRRSVVSVPTNICCDLSQKGWFKIGRKTSRKKYSAKCKEMNSWLKAIRNQERTKEWWKTLEQKLRGHFQYYEVSENYASIARFYKDTRKMVRKWLNRRSQKRKMSWDKFNKYLEHYPLPKPRIVHSFYSSPGW
jgi:four helix bundle protein